MRHLIVPTLLCLVSPPAAADAQPPASESFARVAFLLGRWEGTAEGRCGKGIVRREYARGLNDRFIRVFNRSEYPAQEKSPKGEIHEDQGYISFDRSRKRLVLRQFHVEGFVNQYVEEPGPSASPIVFTSEAIENIPPGWQARETYVVHGPDEFEERASSTAWIAGKNYALPSKPVRNDMRQSPISSIA